MRLRLGVSRHLRNLTGVGGSDHIRFFLRGKHGVALAIT